MNRTGSLSPSSSDTQATVWLPASRSFSHSMSKVVFPKPAGAEIKVSLRPASRSRVAVSRGRATSFGRAWECRSLVDTSESVIGDTWLTSGAYSTLRPSKSSSIPGERVHLLDLLFVGVQAGPGPVDRAKSRAKTGLSRGSTGVLEVPRAASRVKNAHLPQPLCEL